MRGEPGGDEGPVRWRLQAFDLRAGLAFATFRATYRRADTIEDWPCFFLSPPAFMPEPVNSVALAQAAQRGAFEDGLFVDGEEVGFDTLDELAEFVRRAYVSSAGGDGGDDDPSPDEPLPGPGEGPEGWWIPLELERRESSVEQQVQSFLGRVQQVSGGRGFGVGWEAQDDQELRVLVERGALVVLREVLHRAPDMRGPQAVRWLRDARDLAAAMAAAGLWEALQGEHVRRMLEHLSRRPGWHVLEALSHEQRLVLLLFSDMAIDEDLSVDALRRHWYWVGPLWALPRRVIDDPVDLLRRLPAPLWSAMVLPADLRGRESLWQLLSVFCATPQVAAGLFHGPSVIELALFAAACIVTCGAASSGACLVHLPGRPSQEGTLQREAAQGVAREAGEWLMEQLPRHGFSPAVENRIAGATLQRYRAA
jgi:hypothetical protein